MPSESVAKIMKTAGESLKNRETDAAGRVSLWSSLVAMAAMVLVWDLLALWLKTPTLPRPWEVIKVFFRGDTIPLWLHTLASLRRIIISVAIGLIIGVPLGLFLGRNEKVDAFMAPFLYLTYPVPKIVFLPVVLVLFGLGDASRILLITVTLFYQILVTTRDAARSLPPAAAYSLVSLGGNEWDLHRHVLFPYVLPKVFTALRIGIGSAIAVLFFAESYATNSGLGYMIMDSWGRADYPLMFAAIAVMSFLGLGLYLLLEVLERWMCRWMFETR